MMTSRHINFSDPGLQGLTVSSIELQVGRHLQLVFSGIFGDIYTTASLVDVVVQFRNYATAKVSVQALKGLKLQGIHSVKLPALYAQNVQTNFDIGSRGELPRKRFCIQFQNAGVVEVVAEDIVCTILRDIKLDREEMQLWALSK